MFENDRPAGLFGGLQGMTAGTPQAEIDLTAKRMDYEALNRAMQNTNAPEPTPLSAAWAANIHAQVQQLVAASHAVNHDYGQLQHKLLVIEALCKANKLGLAELTESVAAISMSLPTRDARITAAVDDVLIQRERADMFSRRLQELEERFDGAMLRSQVRELHAENERLHGVIAGGDFKDVYAEGLSLGQRLRPWPSEAEQTMRGAKRASRLNFHGYVEKVDALAKAAKAVEDKYCETTAETAIGFWALTQPWADLGAALQWFREQDI